MKIRILFATFFVAATSLGLFASDDADAKRAQEEAVKARLAEHARKNASHGVVRPTPSETEQESVAAIGAPVGKAASGQKQADATAESAKAPQEPATILPKYEVKNDKITEADRQIEKQNELIAREKQNTKPTPLDNALNGQKISTALAIFGGQSSDDRANVAKERVSMMEDERDIIDAIAQATTKEEKKELEQTLADMREMRRELEHSMQ